MAQHTDVAKAGREHEMPDDKEQESEAEKDEDLKQVAGKDHANQDDDGEEDEEADTDQREPETDVDDSLGRGRPSLVPRWRNRAPRSPRPRGAPQQPQGSWNHGRGQARRQCRRRAESPPESPRALCAQKARTLSLKPRFCS